METLDRRRSNRQHWSLQLRNVWILFSTFCLFSQWSSETERRHQCSVIGDIWPAALKHLMNQSEPCSVLQWGPERIRDEFPSLSDTFSQQKDKPGDGRNSDKRTWWRGTSLREPVGWSRGQFNSWQTATTTACNIWAAHHSQNEQKHSRSGRMKRSLSLFWIVFFFFFHATMWYEQGRIKDVDSCRGKFRSTRGNSSVASDKTVGGEGKKRFEGETHVTLTSRLSKAFVLTQLCSTETMMEVSKSYFGKIRSTLSLMRPFSVHWIQN